MISPSLSVFSIIKHVMLKIELFVYGSKEALGTAVENVKLRSPRDYRNIEEFVGW